MFEDAQPDFEWVESRENNSDGEEDLPKTEESGLREDEDHEGFENPVLAYVRDIGRYPLLRPKEELELATEIQAYQERLLRLLTKVPLAAKEIEQLKSKANRGKKERSRDVLIDEVLWRLRDIDRETIRDETQRAALGQIHQLETRLHRASDRMVRSNLRLVFSISRHYLNRGLSLLDLIQEGNIGLMKAVSRFDPRKGYRFSTYAIWWIRQAIQRAIEKKGRTIRMPVYMLHALSRYDRVMNSTAEQSRELLPEQIMEKAGLSPRQLESLRNRVKEPLSLDALLGDRETKLIDLVPDRNSQSPSEVAMQQELSEKVRQTLKMLTSREEWILKQRFGIGGYRTYTLEEIGRHLGISRERVRQIEKRALGKLKMARQEKPLKELESIEE